MNSHESYFNLKTGTTASRRHQPFHTHTYIHTRVCKCENNCSKMKCGAHSIWYLFLPSLEYNRINSHYLSIVFCFSSTFTHIAKMFAIFMMTFAWPPPLRSASKAYLFHLVARANKLLDNCKMQLDRQNCELVWCVISNLLSTVHAVHTNSIDVAVVLCTALDCRYFSS